MQGVARVPFRLYDVFVQPTTRLNDSLLDVLLLKQDACLLTLKGPDLANAREGEHHACHTSFQQSQRNLPINPPHTNHLPKAIAIDAVTRVIALDPTVALLHLELPMKRYDSTYQLVSFQLHPVSRDGDDSFDKKAPRIGGTPENDSLPPDAPQHHHVSSAVLEAFAANLADPDPLMAWFAIHGRIQRGLHGSAIYRGDTTHLFGERACQGGPPPLRGQRIYVGGYNGRRYGDPRVLDRAKQTLHQNMYEQTGKTFSGCTIWKLPVPAFITLPVEMHADGVFMLSE